MEEKEMNIKRLFVTLFRAIDCLHEEKPNKDMQCFLADANPYLFKDRNAAVADVQHSFEDFIGNVDFKDISSLYDIVYNYLKVNYSFADEFLNISQSEWRDLCKIIDNECDEEQTLLDI